MLSASVPAPTPFSLPGSPPHLAPTTSPRTLPWPPPQLAARSSARIAVVGDVHDQWNLEDDTKALELLQPDLVLFTGDFGEENVELVKSVANLDFAKAVILGNHDAWHTTQFSGKKKDSVQLQLEWLSAFGLSYVSIVGERPFSCGGKNLFRQKLLSARFGVQDMDGSAKRIHKAASGAPEDHLVIFLAHNGPTGLGSNVDDICGKDWVFGGGDHGDPDLAQALSLLKETGKVSAPLVVFGHMHKELADGNGLRKMIVVGDDNTIYLNGAIVPRVKRLNVEQGTPESCGTMRAFTLMEILNGTVDNIVESWVSVAGDRITLEEEHFLFKSGG